MPHVVFPGNVQKSTCRVSLLPSVCTVCAAQKKVILGLCFFSQAIINIIYLLCIAVEPEGLN